MLDFAWYSFHFGSYGFPQYLEMLKYHGKSRQSGKISFFFPQNLCSRTILRSGVLTWNVNNLDFCRTVLQFNVFFTNPKLNIWWNSPDVVLNCKQFVPADVSLSTYITPRNRVMSCENRSLDLCQCYTKRRLSWQQPSPAFEGERVQFYSLCHVKIRLGWDSASQVFFQYDNDKNLKTCFSVAQLKNTCQNGWSCTWQYNIVVISYATSISYILSSFIGKVLIFIMRKQYKKSISTKNLFICICVLCIYVFILLQGIVEVSD